MKVCFFGTYRSEYNRNKIMLASMKAAGIEVVECHEELWESIEDRVNVTTGGWLKPSFWLRVIKSYSRLIKKFNQVGDFDVLMTGYPGHFDIFLAKRLAKKRKKPLVSDIFMSLYVIAALERHLDKSKLNAVKLVDFLERRAYRKPLLLIHDTLPYSQWLCDHFDIPIEKFRLVPTGADETIFKPSPDPQPAKQAFTVLFYGTFIPNHGLEIVSEAMNLLREEGDLKFLFVGEGPERAKLVARTEAANLKNVEFIGWVDQSRLVDYIQEADLCLGAFGATPQSMMTVHNKVYENMACGKAFLTGESPAIKAQFENGKEILYCHRTGSEIAEAILRVKNDPALKMNLESNGRARFVQDYSFEAQGKRIHQYLEEALDLYRSQPR